MATINYTSGEIEALLDLADSAVQPGPFGDLAAVEMLGSVA